MRNQLNLWILPLLFHFISALFEKEDIRIKYAQ